jgi:hypothetical protein
VSFENTDYETRSIFVEGERVKFVRDDWPSLPMGSIGIVLWVYYWPLYEVTFTDCDGLVFDNTYDENDLSKAEPEAV